MENDPSLVACTTVFDVIQDGLKKHEPEGWRNESASFHLHKAARHALTAAMIEDGHIPPDGEDHAALSLTRTAMALSVKSS